MLRTIAPFAIAALLSLTGTIGAQTRIPLDGTWQIRPENAPDAWRDVQVPAAFETALGAAFDGVARYRLTLPETPGATTRLAFEFAAVATHATVLLNGQRLGEHLGGWTPFRVEASTAWHRDGPNVLEVVVDERVGHNTQGFLPIVQPHFGGIWQGVTLCADDGPTLDRLDLSLFGRWNPAADSAPPARFEWHVGVRDAQGATVEVTLRDEHSVLRRVTKVLKDDAPFDGTAALRQCLPWEPGAPQLYDVEVRLLRDRLVLDQVTRKVGFRALDARGTTVSWNGQPLSLRGVLHWGYSPPSLCPPSDPEHWRRQLRYFQSLGFNCLKCCLWVPPRCVYELCDELGMLVWQEYPTWHPQMDRAHQQELLTEYREFFRHDRDHAAVAFRSITCETGHSADLEVVKALYQACKDAVPNTLVVDDSSWIGWQRITDFWDEHPYGNNSWLPGRLQQFRQHIREKGEKPLLLGECLAADTWVDVAAWREAHGEAPTWYRPACWDAQLRAETWLRREFGAATLAALQPTALAFGLQSRKFQIEQLRLTIPDAGYVVSVARDIPKCRMGLYDDLDRPKWAAEDWAWHGDTMLCLDLPFDRRALAPGQTVQVRIAHRGFSALKGTLTLRADLVGAETSYDVALAPGQVSEPFDYFLDAWPTQATRLDLEAKLTGSVTAANSWPLWLLGTPSTVPADSVIEAEALTGELLEQLLAGARVLLHAGDGEGAARADGIWFLKGAPFAPSHPAHQRVPAQMLLDLAAFDLESGKVMPWGGWMDQVDPILGFWETHDIDDVRFWLHAFDTNVGEGRLLVTAMRHDAPHGGGRYVLEQLRAHLAEGPAPKRSLSAATIAALRDKLRERMLDLETWRFRTDPDDRGLAGRWFAPTTDVSAAPWRDMKAGSHWENQGEDVQHYTGIAWYRIDVDVPDDWAGLDARAVFDGVDDSFTVWLDGARLGQFGDPATGTTVWLEQQVQPLGQRLTPGRHTLVLRVVDHAGAGGLWKPARLTTGPTGAAADLLR
ncbi:MAG: hypothetical protein H6835_13045 [Planctomycetes bacterium]|nr:hypothetical protein [Planctomycetota bacterium]